ncbi:nickel-dependent lactate racemase [Patescibacteria group bacterium]|nr:nickel-dependent lactate racemase [Patescibacteria group bacterium]
MKKRLLTLRYGKSKVEVKIPEENLVYTVGPKDLPGLRDEKKSIKESLNNPIQSAPLYQEVKKGMKVVIIGDDITRPTPRERIFSPLLDELNEAGIPDRDIKVLIALGTHRYMSKEEIEVCFGKGITERVKVLNHEWQDKTNLVRIGSAPTGTPIEVNKIAYEADYLIGVGSIVPHSLAGYGGGAKIVQPGICSWETTGKTHLLPVERDDFLSYVGNPENRVRLEMEEVARIVGLDFIVNVVLNVKEEIVDVVSGDPIKAHRKGVEVARRVYERKIPELADIIIISAYPAEIDYWQGIKPLSYAQHGLKKGGIVILLASFPDGISPTHFVGFERYADRSYGEIKGLVKKDKIEDLVCASTLLQHVLIRNRCEVICISEGLSIKQKEKLGLRHADGVEEALEVALAEYGKRAKIGVIDYGGDVLPRLS